MAQNYASLYHNIHPKDFFFKFSTFIGHSNEAKISESEIFKKIPFFGSDGQLWLNCGPKLFNLVSQDQLE